MSQAESVAEPVEAIEAELLDIEYPCSDGLAMSESDFQARALMNARHFLATPFRERRDVYVSGNILIYYKQGNRYLTVSPDILVAFGVERCRRRRYQMWDEGKAPDFVLEVLSPSIWTKDRDEKRRTYARVGVREYFLFDPTGEHIEPVLQGYRLDRGRHEPLAALGPLAVGSRVLDLDLWVDEERDLRMRDAATMGNLWSAEESGAGRHQAEARAEREARLRLAAEHRAAYAEDGAEQAEVRVKRVETRVDEEARMRRAAEARLAELEQRLKSSR